METIKRLAKCLGKNITTKDKLTPCERSTQKLLTKVCKLEKKLKKQGRLTTEQQTASDELQINLLLLGPGEVGKSTLIKQMQLIHGDTINEKERCSKIPYIRQNIFDSIIAILAAMRHLNISLSIPELEPVADRLLSYSQVEQPELSSKDVLQSEYLASQLMIEDVKALWVDEGVHQSFRRSNEYQLLDCAAYFFDRLDDINLETYIPTEQDVLRCRTMTTSIKETKLSAPCGRHKMKFKVVDVGGQQGERRKWITLLDNNHAVVFMIDAASFDQTLREDSTTNRLLESLKLFHQTVSSRYLQNISTVAFLNKIDLLRKKIEDGANFEEAIRQITVEALTLSTSPRVTENDRSIYRHLFELLSSSPYHTYTPSDSELMSVGNLLSLKHNHGSSLQRQISSLMFRRSSHMTAEQDEVLKAAAYIKMLLMKIVDSLKTSSDNNGRKFHVIASTAPRKYEYQLTCAVNREYTKHSLDNFKRFIAQDYLEKLKRFSK